MICRKAGLTAAVVVVLAGAAVTARAQPVPPPGGVPIPPPLPAPATPLVPPPLPQQAAVSFYVADNGQPVGPLSLDDLKRRIASGTLTRATPVWKTGAPSWIAAHDLPELAGLFLPSGAQAVVPPALPAATLPPPPNQPPASQPAAGVPGFGQISPQPSEPSTVQPPSAQPPDSAGATEPNYADESTDFGVAPQRTLQAKVGSPTPTSVPDAQVITTQELSAALQSNRRPVLIDALGSPHSVSLPGAVRLSYAGRAGSTRDAVERRLATALSRVTQGRLDTPIILFCLGSQCWESYNAVLRAVALGYTNVFWYRGGLAAWQAAGPANADALGAVVAFSRHQESGRSYPSRDQLLRPLRAEQLVRAPMPREAQPTIARPIMGLCSVGALDEMRRPS